MARLNSRDSRGQLGWKLEISSDEVKGTVRNAAPYDRYIQSPQISPNINAGQTTPTELRPLYAKAKTTADYRQVNAVESKLKAENRAQTRKSLQVRQYMRGKGGGKLTGKAARSGSAVWILLRWPEAAASRRLTENLGPLLEPIITESTR